MKEAIIQYNEDPDGVCKHIVINWREFIRCKDCKHYNPDKKWCQHLMIAKGGGWFCGDGVKKERTDSL